MHFLPPVLLSGFRGSAIFQRLWDNPEINNEYLELEVSRDSDSRVICNGISR